MATDDDRPRPTTSRGRCRDQRRAPDGRDGQPGARGPGGRGRRRIRAVARHGHGPSRIDDHAHAVDGNGVGLDVAVDDTDHLDDERPGRHARQAGQAATSRTWWTRQGPQAGTRARTDAGTVTDAVRGAERIDRVVGDRDHARGSQRARDVTLDRTAVQPPVHPPGTRTAARSPRSWASPPCHSSCRGSPASRTGSGARPPTGRRSGCRG